jgi:putative CocE/NonD family hydrolase
VPFTQAIASGMTREYMTEDQRFAGRRPDVLVFATPPLEEDLVVAGPLVADLRVSTSAGDADWIVKLIDEMPPDTPDPDWLDAGQSMSGYQMLVRGEVFRGRYRESYAEPRPFEAGVPTPVRFELQDVLHRFAAGHRILVHVQSTWFPLVDRNPQKFVPSIFRARGSDFVAAEHRVYHSPEHPSCLRLGVLRAPDEDGRER